MVGYNADHYLTMAVGISMGMYDIRMPVHVGLSVHKKVAKLGCVPTLHRTLHVTSC